MKSGDVKELAGFILMGLVGPVTGFSTWVTAWDIIPKNFPWLLKMVISGLALIVSASIIMGVGFVLITKKYNKTYYDQRLKGHTK